MGNQLAPALSILSIIQRQANIDKILNKYYTPELDYSHRTYVDDKSNIYSDKAIGDLVEDRDIFRPLSLEDTSDNEYLGTEFTISPDYKLMVKCKPLDVSKIMWGNSYISTKTRLGIITGVISRHINSMNNLTFKNNHKVILKELEDTLCIGAKYNRMEVKIVMDRCLSKRQPLV